MSVKWLKLPPTVSGVVEIDAFESLFCQNKPQQLFLSFLEVPPARRSSSAPAAVGKPKETPVKAKGQTSIRGHLVGSTNKSKRKEAPAAPAEPPKKKSSGGKKSRSKAEKKKKEKKKPPT